MDWKKAIAIPGCGIGYEVGAVELTNASGIGHDVATDLIGILRVDPLRRILIILIAIRLLIVAIDGLGCILKADGDAKIGGMVSAISMMVA